MNAGWHPDPNGQHELRYWDGQQWTEHVSNGGVATVSPLGGQPSAAVEDFGALNVQGEILWSGERKSLTAAATGGKVVSARYTVTTQAITFSAGLVSTREEMIPLRAVVDADLRQSMTQKARGVGDIWLKVDNSMVARYGQNGVALESIQDPRSVREIILTAAHKARSEYMTRTHERNVELNRAGASSITIGHQSPPPPAPVAPAPVSTGNDSITQLKQLAELRDAGVLTDEEFAAQKAKILGL